MNGKIQTRPRLLDLFCGAGGAAVGYHRAGFDVVGVDIKPQPNYPFRFHQGNALRFLLDLEFLSLFDAVHASPPCQDHSMLKNSAGIHATGWLLYATLELLREADIAAYVVENVVGAVMPSPIELCGATFALGASGMDLPRHRVFQCSFPMMSPPCQHRRGKTMGVYGHGMNKWHREKLGRNLTIAEMREAMGIDWMTGNELSQAIPPAFTEYVGAQLLAHLEAKNQ